MEARLHEHIIAAGITPWSDRARGKRPLKALYKTKDAKMVHQKVVSFLSSTFHFGSTAHLWDAFSFDLEQVRAREDYFSLAVPHSTPLAQLKSPRATWRIPYAVCIATEDEEIYVHARKMGCDAVLLETTQDVSRLEDYGVVYAVGCEEFMLVLDQMESVLFVDTLEHAYLERHLVTLSAWEENFSFLEEGVPAEIKDIICTLKDLCPTQIQHKTYTRDEVFSVCDDLNKEVMQTIAASQFSGEHLVQVLSNTLPDSVKQLVCAAISDSALPQTFFTETLPIQVDEEALESYLKQQEQHSAVEQGKMILHNARILCAVPTFIAELERELLIWDHRSGVRQVTSGGPVVFGDTLSLQKSCNLLLDAAQPITFTLNEEHKCSLLTGANSGGKTTLVEHIIQLTTLQHLGIPASGTNALPTFTQIYYFAKNKGSASKGAFETLLTQLSSIEGGKGTLILADEIEAVTEPGVAAKIIRSTVDYFVQSGSYMVLATHVGQALQRNIPKGARIDGIEAKGIGENNELLVDHNPVMGRLAHSTPELIVERMARTKQHAYFKHLHSALA